jgi:hypothetical protein
MLSRCSAGTGEVQGCGEEVGARLPGHSIFHVWSNGGGAAGLCTVGPLQCRTASSSHCSVGIGKVQGRDVGGARACLNITHHVWSNGGGHGVQDCNQVRSALPSSPLSCAADSLLPYLVPPSPQCVQLHSFSHGIPSNPSTRGRQQIGHSPAQGTVSRDLLE